MMTPENKRTADALAEVIRIMGQAGVEFAMIVHAGGKAGNRAPLFFSSDPPPDGARRARAALDECERLQGLMVATVPERH